MGSQWLDVMRVVMPVACGWHVGAMSARCRRWMSAVDVGGGCRRWMLPALMMPGGRAGGRPAASRVGTRETRPAQ